MTKLANALVTIGKLLSIAIQKIMFILQLILLIACTLYILFFLFIVGLRGF